MKHRLLDLDPNEVVLHEIKRHPVGLIQIYLIGVFVFILSLFLLFVLLKNQTLLGADISSNGVAVFFLLLSVVIVMVTYIAGSIYKANELVVTNESVIQILQTGLFDRKISQLPLGQIQDVTGNQSGIMPSLFNYGTLTIETAGEATNYIFTYAPDPNITAKQIIEASDQFVRTSGGNNISRKAA